MLYLVALAPLFIGDLYSIFGYQITCYLVAWNFSRYPNMRKICANGPCVLKSNYKEIERG